MAESKTPERPHGYYANYLKVGQNAFEFLFIFGHHFLEDGLVNQEALSHTRIATTPVYAKAFLKVLEESVNDHERSFGAISDEIVDFVLADQGWKFDSENIS